MRILSAPTPEWRPELTILADVSANLFAVCLLILLTLLAIGAAPTADAPPPPAAPIDAEATFDVVERAPLDAGAMVEHLRARGMPDSAAIDLFADGIALGGRPGEARIRPDAAPEVLAGAVRGFDPRRVVRLYVFDPRWYKAVVTALRGRGLSFVELSIPAALRSPDGADWSPAFRTLATRNLAPEPFRAGLAELLAGGVGPRTTGGGAASPAGSVVHPGLAERFAAWLRGFAAFAIPLAGLALVLAIEASERRRLTRGAG